MPLNQRDIGGRSGLPAEDCHGRRRDARAAGNPAVSTARTEDRPRIATLVMADGIGDATMRLPFLHALRRAYPQHELWWIASENSVMAGPMRRFTGIMIDRVIEHAELEKPAKS